VIPPLALIFPLCGEQSRLDIQSWGRCQAITERSSQRIFHAADQILRAGRSAKPTDAVQ